jgi:tRNA dimethylallyltransferase
MGSITDNAPLVVVLGQTASGKSALGMNLAKKFDGEIIAADSRTVYRGMDIGTAKPTTADRQAIRHHLVDVVRPDQAFTVADFKQQANAAIDDIVSRGKLPIMVGGSGLYIDAVIYNFSFRKSPNSALRSGLQNHSVSQLQELLVREGIELPPNQGNPRHLVRSLESVGEVPRREDLRQNTLVIGLAKEKQELERIITKRVESMVRDGLVHEVQSLAGQYGWDIPALQAPAYKAFRMYLAGGHSTLDQAKSQFVQNDLQYAKRQKTWFKRNKDIIWISKPEDAVDLVTTFLNKRYMA